MTQPSIILDKENSIIYLSSSGKTLTISESGIKVSLPTPIIENLALNLVQYLIVMPIVYAWGLWLFAIAAAGYTPKKEEV
jgi:hypothetical protein